MLPIFVKMQVLQLPNNSFLKMPTAVPANASSWRMERQALWELSKFPLLGFLSVNLGIISVVYKQVLLQQVLMVVFNGHIAPILWQCGLNVQIIMAKMLTSLSIYGRVPLKAIVTKAKMAVARLLLTTMRSRISVRLLMVTIVVLLLSLLKSVRVCGVIINRSLIGRKLKCQLHTLIMTCRKK